jgi:hypothetical protein
LPLLFLLTSWRNPPASRRPPNPPFTRGNPSPWQQVRQEPLSLVHAQNRRASCLGGPRTHLNSEAATNTNEGLVLAPV